MQSVQTTYLGAFPYHNKNGAILDSAYSYNGLYLAVCNTNGQVYVYDTTNEQSKKPYKTYKNHKAAALKVCWSNSKLKFILASCSIDHTINFYNQDEIYLTVNTGEIIPTCLMFAPLEDIVIAVGLSNGNLKLFNNKGVQSFETYAHESALTCLEWNYQYDKTNIDIFKKNLPGVEIHAQKLVLATGSSDRMIKIWEISKGVPYDLKNLMTINSHQKEIRSLSWKQSILDNYFFLTTASNDGVIKNWELNFDKNEQKQVYSRKIGKTIWKVGWDMFGKMLCVSVMTDEHQNQTYIYELDGNILVYKKIVKEDDE